MHSDPTQTRQRYRRDNLYTSAPADVSSSDSMPPDSNGTNRVLAWGLPVAAVAFVAASFVIGGNNVKPQPQPDTRASLVYPGSETQRLFAEVVDAARERNVSKTMQHYFSFVENYYQLTSIAKKTQTSVVTENTELAEARRLYWTLSQSVTQMINDYASNPAAYKAKNDDSSVIDMQVARATESIAQFWRELGLREAKVEVISNNTQNSEGPIVAFSRRPMNSVEDVEFFLPVRPIGIRNCKLLPVENSQQQP